MMRAPDTGMTAHFLCLERSPPPVATDTVPVKTVGLCQQSLLGIRLAPASSTACSAR
jgi:hypothetical protein